MMPPADGWRRRANDQHPLYRGWLALPLVDRGTGDLSLSRILSAAFAVATIRWMAELRQAEITWPTVVLVTTMAMVTLAAAFGKRIFEAVALRLAGRTEQAAAPAGAGGVAQGG